MGKPTGFLDYTRVDCPSRDVAARTGDYPAPSHRKARHCAHRRSSSFPSAAVSGNRSARSYRKHSGCPEANSRIDRL